MCASLRKYYRVCPVFLTCRSIRWPTITLTLININMEAPRAKIETIKANELSVRTKEVTSANLKKRNEDLINVSDILPDIRSNSFQTSSDTSEFSQYAQTPSNENIYLMFERFRNITL